MAYISPLEIIMAKETTELILLFYKNITKLVFLWPNMGQKSFKVLSNRKKIHFETAITKNLFLSFCEKIIKRRYPQSDFIFRIARMKKLESYY